MSPLRFDLLVLAMVTAAVVIAGVYLFMIAVPRNDDEHIHDALSAPEHLKLRVLRRLAQLRRRFARRRPDSSRAR